MCKILKARKKNAEVVAGGKYNKCTARLQKAHTVSAKQLP